MAHPDVQLPGRFTPQQAADLAEIQQRIFFYGWCIDHRRFDDLDGVFLPDSVIHYDTDGGSKGPWTEMKPWLTKLSVFRCTQHNMCNPMVRFDESGDRAWSTTYGYLMHMQETTSGEKSVMKHSAIYRDEWQRIDGEWKILARTLSDVGVEGTVHFDGVVGYDAPVSW